MMRLQQCVVALAVVALNAWAQCSMCQTSAAAQDQAVSRAFNAAILVLFVPAVGLFCGVFHFSFYSRNHEEAEEATHEHR
jgi:heme/copper-type cytochrome/quinol oxidase subunit 2